MVCFSEQDIENDSDYGSFTRGREYFNRDKVLQLNIAERSNDSIRITSQVAGSYPYHQNITVSKQRNVIHIFGNCSCPVGYNCKHVVAALFYHLQSEQKTSPQFKPKRVKDSVNSELNLWFDQLNNIPSKFTESNISKPTQWLAYIFEYEENCSTIKIKFARTGIKKAGGYYKPQPIRFNNLCQATNSHYDSSYVNSFDKIIISLLKTQYDFFYSYAPILLEGQIGKEVLEKILLSKRCFWSEITQENLISHGEERKTEYSWQRKNNSKNSAMKLVNNTPVEQMLIKTEPPYYIDTKRMTIGRLMTTLTAQHLDFLDSMPFIPNSSLKELSLKLIANNFDHAIPLPTSIEIVDLDAQHLSPKILLQRINLDNVGAKKRDNVHCLKVSWLYEEIDVQPYDKKLIFINKNEKYLRVSRDLEHENRYFNQLLELNFEPLYRKVSGEQPVGDYLLSPSLKSTNQQQLLQWKKFIETDIPALTEQGWIIETDENFNLDFIQAEDEWDVEVVDENDWFSLKFDLNLSSGEKLPLIPLISPLLKEYSLTDVPEKLLIEAAKGQYISLPKSKVMPILKLLYELFDTPPLSQNSIKLSKFDALQIEQLSQNSYIELKWFGGKKLKTLANKLATFTGLKTVSPSKKFQGELRDYQQQGLNWLQFLRDFGFSGLLADDMGLGKTVQALVHLQKEKMSKRMQQPCLIVAPTSLMSNWKKEAKIFTPNLKILILQGAERHQYFSHIEQYDLVLTTYPLIVRDFEILSKTKFYTIVLDEAQNIKNPKAKATKLIKSFNTKHRLALTGTPMENHLGEMWSIFDFLMPGFLGGETSFKRKYRTPIEKHGDIELSKMLALRVKPFLLRRTKDVVAKELPPKTTIIKSAIFDNGQAALYETIRIAMEQKIMQALATKGLNRSHITILDALLKLRQVCCDPQLLKLPQAKKIKQSAKLELLMSMLPELIEEGRKILIFSQFTSMLKLIENQLKLKAITYTQLTGSTKHRDQVIEKFTSGEVPVFLISLKAGGVGLNLTEADTVIHYDPWWNPAVENQASDRAHRIGQDKPVFVYKLIVENTLEEKILEMQDKKQALADGVYGKQINNNKNTLTAQDIEELLGVRHG